MKLIDCPRDAMQGLEHYVPADVKARYINLLLQAGFDTIDFGSFVSPRAVPQMRDTAEVLSMLELENRSSKLLAIVANVRGANDAASFDEINYLGFPFSISEEFQQRNTGSSIDESLGRVEEIQEICRQNGKEMVVYLSMAFGNPYGEPWHPDIAAEWSERLHLELEVSILALSDTIGSSNPENIKGLFTELIPAFPEVEFGAHLHSKPESWKEKIEAAYHAGCRRFDSALRGYGGCPMSGDDLTGNVATESVVQWMDEMEIASGINQEALAQALRFSPQVFDPPL